MNRPNNRRLGWVSLTAAAAVVVAMTSIPAEAADDPGGQPGDHAARPAPVRAHQALKPWQQKIAGLDRSRRATTAYFVRFRGPGAASAQERSGGAAAFAVRANTKRLADSTLRTARRADSRAKALFTVSNAIPGMGVSATPSAIRQIARSGDVLKVSRIVPKTAGNAYASQLTLAARNWRGSGGTGAGVKIGIIDTGIDYTHADFGGPGTAKAYQQASGTNASWLAGLPALGRAKFIGGYDFAGDSYDADPGPDFQPVPQPDPDPLDCGEHGTHVAGSAAGYGVTADGTTYRGRYTRFTGTQLNRMKVGPGMAPRATLYALKVFGCNGSTDLVIPALDRALDPNGDGRFGDHLDIVNLSLGSDYGTVDDPENDVINALTRHGVLSVAAIGNNGDLTDTGGSPGNAKSALSVASTRDALQLRDGVRVDAPAALEGLAGAQLSTDYDWAGNGPSHGPVSGTVVGIPGANADGCDAYSDPDRARVAGKVVWLEWDDNDDTRACGSAVRADNAHAAGAIGAIFTSGLSVFPGGISGNATIPVAQLTKAVKPDVAAPGDTIVSAGMGSGNGALVLSGTSMATPITARSATSRSTTPCPVSAPAARTVRSGSASPPW